MSHGQLIASDLFEQVLLEPARRGATELYILSGYASASMVTKHFERLQKELSHDFSIDLHIGMSGRDGLSTSTLLGLQAIPRQIGNRTFNCTLSTRGTSNHSKMFVWCDESGPKEAFLGSSNYTQFGFGLSESSRTHREVCIPMDPIAGFDYVLASSRGGISYKSPDISEFVDLYDQVVKANDSEEESVDISNKLAFVDLPLIMTRPNDGGEVHRKSGLNWGQREGRNPDQAYLPVPSLVAQSKFFPEKGVHFQVVTDDGEAFICTVAQEGDKALETPSDNSILGVYFRKKLGLTSGEYIRKDHLEVFGSNLVRIYKDSDEFYRLSFQPGRLLG